MGQIKISNLLVVPDIKYFNKQVEHLT